MSHPQDLTTADAEAFRVLEERLAMPAPTESRETLVAMLAEGFQEFGSSGQVFDTEAVLEALVVPGGRLRIQLEDFTATVVTAGVVLMRYVSRSVAGAGWKPPVLRSSLWCYREGRWQLLFHQGTRLSADER
jgi:hypothetical protein